MRILLLALVVLSAACGRDVGLSTAPKALCPENAATVMTPQDSLFARAGIPTISVYVCNGIVPKH